MACAMRARRSSLRIDSACALKRITAGSRIALSVPWCRRGAMPPSEWLRLCTQPRPFWNASAPCIEALIMFRRASRSPGVAVARSMWRQARRRPSSAMPSAGGLKAGAMKVSMQCAIASMPVAAVSIGGRPSVSSGSHSATRGTRCGESTPTLRPSSRISTAPRPTSLPVPAVVGTAITGAVAAVMRATPPSMAAKDFSGPSCVAHTATPLARSIGEPPPTATMPSQRCSA